MLVIVLKVSKEKQRAQKIEKRLDSYLSGFISKKRMPIEEKEIERVKQTVSLAAVIRSRGVELKRKGKQLWGLCPFHSEDEPSFAVDEKKGLWNCLGKCQTRRRCLFVCDESRCRKIDPAELEFSRKIGK